MTVHPAPKPEATAATTIQRHERGRHSRNSLSMLLEKPEAPAPDVDTASATRAPRRQKAARWFMRKDVALHCHHGDLWLSVLGRVLNLTGLVAKHSGSSVQPLIDAAGTDVSHWFDPSTGDVRTHVSPLTEHEAPYTPRRNGGVAFLHVPDHSRVGSDVEAPPEVPWWRDESLMVGRLTARSRKVRLLNMESTLEVTLEVPSEEIIGDIATRYIKLVFDPKARQEHQSVLLNITTVEP
jgi:hypothetical protein